ncbi:unnamed protein product [Lampetra planeri]
MLLDDCLCSSSSSGGGGGGGGGSRGSVVARRFQGGTFEPSASRPQPLLNLCPVEGRSLSPASSGSPRRPAIGAVDSLPKCRLDNFRCPLRL